MQMKSLMGLAIALAVAGCGKGVDQHRLVSGEAQLAKPGEWREKRETRIEAPGIEPRVEDERTDTHCLKGEGDPVRSEVTEKFASLCDSPALRFADGKISGESNCRFSSGTSERMPVRVSGNYGPDHIEMITDAQYQGATIRQLRTLERIGDCETAAEAMARDPWSATENKEAAGN
jgi:hypothetical protein